MKKLHTAIIVGVLFACSGAVSAVEPQAAEAAASQSRPMTVVVSVSDQGRVTNLRYSEKLPSGVAKLLKSTISQWITKPAVVNGRHVPSQLLMTVDLQTKPAANGQKELHIAYVSSEAIRMNSAWKIVDGHVFYTGSDYVREQGGIDPPKWDNQQAAPPPPSPPSGSGQGNHS